MITTNSDGQPISAGFAEALSEGIVWYDVRLFESGQDLGCKIVRLALSLGSSADSGDVAGGVPIGSVTSGSMTASLTDVQQQLLGHELEVRVGVLVGESYEYVTVALVTVTGSWTAAGVTQVEAVGRISALMSGTPCGLAGGTYAPSAVVTAIQQASGITVALGAFAGTSGILVPIVDGSSCRAALSALALALGGFATETHDGGVLVAPLPTGGHTTTLDPGIMPHLPQLSDEQCSIDGLTVVSTSDDPEVDPPSWTFGTGRIVIELPGATQASATALWNNIRYATWRPGTATVAVLDPRITPFDVAEVTLDEATREVPTWGIEASYDGGLYGTYSAQGFTEAGEEATLAGPMQTAIGEIRAASAVAISASARAEEAAGQAVRDAATAQTAASQATTAAGRAMDAATAAGTAAADAQRDANAANASAKGALLSLATVEDVVDTLTWITKHGTMTLTTDTQVDPSKIYFVPDASGQYVVGGSTYAIVQNPTIEGLSGYYELAIDKSVENYIATHVSVTEEGLWLTPTSSSGYRVLIATGAGTTYTTAGTYIIDASGIVVAQFTTANARIGREGSGYVLVDSSGMTVHNSDGIPCLEVSSSSGMEALYKRFTISGARVYARTSPATEMYQVNFGTSYEFASGAILNIVLRGYAGGDTFNYTCRFEVGTSSTVNLQNALNKAEYQVHYDGAHYAYLRRTSPAINDDHTDYYYRISYAETTVNVHAPSIAMDGSVSGHAPYASSFGEGLLASSNHQTVLGRYNVEDANDSNVLIIGNGLFDDSTGELVRSNALAVGWDGNILAQAMAGIVQMFAGATPPSGWLECDGQEVSRTTYAVLFAAIGTTWGAGDGSTTFNLPDLRGRGPIGAGTGSGLTARTLGDTGGSESHNHGGNTGGHSLTVAELAAHTHTINHGHAHTLGTDSKGGHEHRLKYNANTSGSGTNRHTFTASGSSTTTNPVTNTAGAHTHDITGSITNHTGNSGSNGSGTAHSHTISNADNMQPFAVVKFIICTGKTS